MTQLAQFTACQNRIDEFRVRTGEEREITREFVKTYYFYPWTWAGKNLLSEEYAEEFIRVREQFIEEHKENARGKSISERRKLRKLLRSRIALLFCELYNDIYDFKLGELSPESVAKLEEKDE